MDRAIVLLNMGGPNSLDEVEIFLKNMFNDPNILTIKNATLRRLLAYLITKSRKNEAQSNYKRLGGKSPLGYYTNRLIEKLQKALPSIYITKAMRYTPPFAKDAIKELIANEISEVYLIALYPHYSTTTTKSSLEDFYNSAQALGYKGRLHHIKGFYEHPIFNEAIVERIDEALEGEDASEYELIFSAHSLPQKIIERGDPYFKEVKAHVELLKEMLGKRFHSYHLAFQSKLGPVKWLEPSLDEKLKELQGKKVLIYPISFILDNSETEFELHIQYAAVAKKMGISSYKVARCPNDSDTFIKALVDIYKSME